MCCWNWINDPWEPSQYVTADSLVSCVTRSSLAVCYPEPTSITMTSHVACCLTSPTTPQLVQQFARANVKASIWVPHHWPFVREIHRWSVDSHHKMASNAESVSILTADHHGQKIICATWNFYRHFVFDKTKSIRHRKQWLFTSIPFTNESFWHCWQC